MIKGLRIKNFKGFKDTGNFDLKPISILIGANSSGKSSILQFLTTLKQTLISGSVDTPLVFQGKYQNLGEVRDVIHKKKDENEIQFEFKIDHHDLKNLYFYKEIKGDLPQGKWLIKCVLTTLSSGRQDIKEYVIFNYKKENSRMKKNIFFKAKRGKRGEFLFSSSNVNVDKSCKEERSVIKEWISKKYFYFTTKVPWHLFANEGTSIFSDKTLNNIMVLIGCSAQIIEDSIRNFHYIGGLREYPQRLYIYGGELPEDVGKTGEKTMDALVIDRINRKDRIINELNKWLNKFELLSSISIDKIPEISAYKTSVVHTDKSTSLSLPDVGFGVSQILPLLVESLFSKGNSTIIIEQPELHLHPKVQSLLANFFVEMIKDRNKHFVIETHSEHLLLRLRNLILNEDIKSSDVGIYYVEKKNDESVLREVGISEDGNFENWPEGFFDTSYQEALEFLKIKEKKYADNN